MLVGGLAAISQLKEIYWKKKKKDI